MSTRPVRDYADFERRAQEQRQRTFERFLEKAYERAHRGHPRSLSLIALYEVYRQEGLDVENSYKRAEREAIRDVGGPRQGCGNCGSVNYAGNAPLTACRLCGAALPTGGAA